MLGTDLQVPEQEREYQSDTESHKPRHEQERTALQVREILQHRDPFGNFLCSLSENFCLEYYSSIMTL